LYLASKGRCLIVFDHSQLEIRVVAGLSQDAEMLRLILSGVDFHLATAKIIASIFGVDPADVNKEHWLRDGAKTLNFALIYGKSDDSAADDLDIETAMAALVRASILGAFGGLSSWIHLMHQKIREDGGIWIYRSGGVRSRFRPVRSVYSRSRKEFGKALRVAVNTPVQGGGSEVNNAGLIACHRWLTQNPIGRYVSMPLAVHDSIVFDADFAACDEVLDVVPRLMTNFDIGVPLVIDCKKGERLGSCEKVKVRQ
jgi:DNA polymerase-1